MAADWAEVTDGGWGGGQPSGSRSGLPIGGNSDSGGPGDLAGADGEADPAGPGEGGGEAGPAGPGAGGAAGRSCSSDSSVRAADRDGSIQAGGRDGLGWVRGANGRRTWNLKPHVAQTWLELTVPQRGQYSVGLGTTPGPATWCLPAPRAGSEADVLAIC